MNWSNECMMYWMCNVSCRCSTQITLPVWAQHTTSTIAFLTTTIKNIEIMLIIMSVCLSVNVYCNVHATKIYYIKKYSYVFNVYKRTNEPTIKIFNMRNMKYLLVHSKVRIEIKFLRIDFCFFFFLNFAYLNIFFVKTIKLILFPK